MSQRSHFYSLKKTEETINHNSLKSIFQSFITVNPLLSHPGAYLFQNTFEGISCLLKLEYKVEKLKYKKWKVMQPRIKKEVRTSSWLINHPGSVHTKF